MKAVLLISLILVFVSAVPASAQWIYVSSNPQWCVTGWDSPPTLHVYAHSGSEITIGAATS